MSRGSVVARGGGVARGGSGAARGGGSARGSGAARGGGIARGTGSSRRGGINGGTYRRGGIAYGYGGRGGYRRGYGRSQSYFYLGRGFGWPYWYGYGYYRPGFSVSVGIPLYRYYDYYRADYPAYYVDDYAVVDSTAETLPPSDASTDEPDSSLAAEYQLQAEEAFREHRYEDAVRLSHHAVVEDGQNGLLHLFASQTLFALGDYRAAAAAIQQGCAQLERDQWGFVVENFRDFYRGRDYVTQMEALVEFIKQNPDASYAYFLCGYHYKFLGYDEAARIRLAKAVELESQDRLAAELLAMTGGEVPETAEPIPPPDEE